jgi:hypothetical protein
MNSANLTCLNSRFLPTLVITFLYACIVPAAIRLRMGHQGWHWIWNDLAFGFFMMGVLPFAAAIFACLVDLSLLRKALIVKSKQFVVLCIYAFMMVLVSFGVYSDMMNECKNAEQCRVRQPYMFKDVVKMNRLAELHDQTFKTDAFDTGVAEYRKASLSNKSDLSSAMFWLFIVCNFLNVGFAVTVFCYILLASVDEVDELADGTSKYKQIDDRTANHLVYVITALAIWFPCRAYSDWYMNLNHMSWLSSYAAAWVLFALLVAACIVLAVRMVDGTLFHKFAIPAGAISAVIAALAAFKPVLLSRTALALSGFDPIYLGGFALIAIALLYYISTVVHHPVKRALSNP